jgi:mRNA interferase RelE/StbE
MAYVYELSPRAVRAFERLDGAVARRVKARLEELLLDPFGPTKSKQLTNLRGLRSSRVGEYRIVFRVLEDSMTLRIETIGPRGDVYRNL